jgi:hypothetical protein
MTFDYTALAELYPTRSYKHRAGSIKYKRFEVAAEAVRFAMEELPPEFLRGTYLEVEEQRFNGQQIRLLYESRDYPLPRKLPSGAHSTTFATRTRPSAGCLPRQPRQRRKAKAVSDRKALALEIAARTKPRFIQIKPEGRAYKATRFIEIPRVRPGGLPLQRGRIDGQAWRHDS